MVQTIRRRPQSQQQQQQHALIFHPEKSLQISMKDDMDSTGKVKQEYDVLKLQWTLLITLLMKSIFLVPLATSTKMLKETKSLEHTVKTYDSFCSLSFLARYFLLFKVPIYLLKK